MSKHRIVKSDFWVDSYVENLSQKEKYFFLYLLTNPNTNILGIYQATFKRMSFETGLDDNEINNILHKFSKDDKVHYIGNHIIMVNFQRHQRPNKKMMTGIVSIFHSLPLDVAEFIYSNKSKITDNLSYYIEHYGYPHINKDIDKDNNNGKDKKPKRSKFSPLKDKNEFIDNIPESMSKKYPFEYLLKVVDDVVDYCERMGKTYNDYYAAMRTFIKNDEKSKKQSGNSQPSTRYQELD